MMDNENNHSSAVQIRNVDSARILAVLPFGSKSHFVAFERYLIELVERNHELVIISPFTSLKFKNNTKIINVANHTDLTVNKHDVNNFLAKGLKPAIINSILSFNRLTVNTTKFFQHPDVQSVLNSNEKFDLVITEIFDTDAMLIFCYKFRTSCIVLSSCALLPWANPRFGNPDNPSYIPSRFSSQVNHMNFWQRLKNTVYLMSYKLAFYYMYTVTSQKIVNKYYLGNDTPSLLEIGMNTSLVLVNTHYSLHGVRPFVPNVIEVGGIHVGPRDKLPKIKYIDSARILVVLPFESKSHFVAFERYIIELVERNHELVIISPFTSLKFKNNTKLISIEDYTDLTVNKHDINNFLGKSIRPEIINSVLSFDTFIINTTKFFQHPDVQRILNSNENFDLVITEIFDTDAMLIFCHKFRTSCIVLSSCALLPWANPRFGNPDNPSYIPSRFSAEVNHMNFWQRLKNTIYLISHKLAFYYIYTDTSQKIVNKYYLGNDTPSLLEIGMNTSLVLVNTHFSLHGVRPFVPNVIEVGGIHVGPAEKLSKSLEKFINESQHGVIYFCMGSVLKASTLPEEKRLDLIEVFSKLKQRVLWKWETESMPDKPDNVKLVKWMPQRDILANPNVKLFITHGGLLGITESIYSGVPIIGIPFFGDQTDNVAIVQAAGIGLRLDFTDLNKDTLYRKIKEILDNPKYKENAQQLSIRFRDRPQTPLETAIYWTEYVIRHKGAPHLKSAAVDLTWYQYFLLDVISFLIISFIIISAILFCAIRYVYNCTKYLLIKLRMVKVNHERKNK